MYSRRSTQVGYNMKKMQNVTNSPEILAAETLLAVTTSETMDEAAKKLGISRQQIYKRIDKYELKEKIVALRENALNELTVGSVKAARKLVTLIDSESEQIAKSASDSVLDRIGLTKGDTTNVNIFQGDVQFINQVPRPKRIIDADTHS